MKLKTLLKMYFYPIDFVEVYDEKGNFLFRCATDEEHIQDMKVNRFYVYEREDETIIEVI